MHVPARQIAQFMTIEVLVVWPQNTADCQNSNITNALIHFHLLVLNFESFWKTNEIILPNSPLVFSGVAGSSLLVVRLNIEPKPMAITVHTKQMTL